MTKTLDSNAAQREVARVGLGRVLMLAAWFGVLTGIAEAVVRITGGLFVTQHVLANPQTIWMAPTANTLVFMAIGLLLAVVGRIWRRAGSTRAAVVVFSFFLLFDLSIFTRPRIHLAPLVLLSAGGAYQLARWIATRQTVFERIVRRSLPIAAALVVLVAGGFITRVALREKGARAALGQARNGAPNVLLLILDTVRAPSLSLYGYARNTTPNLQRMAAKGVLFENAFSTAPWTLPSHASMFTGRYPHELSTGWTSGLDDRYPTVAELLAERGYRTGGFVANPLYGPPAFGLGRGFLHYETYPRTVAYTLSQSNLFRFGLTRINRWLDRYYSPGRKTAAAINRSFLSWLGNGVDRPFFAFLNYYDAHDPYAPPAPFDLMFAKTEPLTRRTQPGRHSAEEITGLRDAYDGAIAYLDSEIGKLYDELNRRGLLENTIVIVTSDHGEEFGEHNVLGHGNSVYIPGLHVPLLIIDRARVPFARRVNEAVTLRDLSATILGLVGLDEKSWPGQSLARTWDAGTTTGHDASPILSEVAYSKNLPTWYPVSRGDLRSIVAYPYHYVRNGDGREELYDIRSDPWEKNDLSGKPEGQRLLAALRAQVNSARGGRSADGSNAH